MDFQTLLRIVDELARLLTPQPQPPSGDGSTGARLERVYEAEGGATCLLLSRDRKTYSLLLSPDRQMPRLHLVKQKPAAASSPRGFNLYLRSHIAGGRLTRIAVLGQDRVVELFFMRQGRELRMIFELTGAASNLIVTDSSSIILAVYYPVPLTGPGQRALIPGMRYEPPVKKAGASGGHKQTTFLTEGEESPNRQAELFYNRLREQRRLDASRSSLRSRTKKALARIERKIEALSVDLTSAQQSEEYRIAGDLILANLGRLRTGMDEVVLNDSEGRSFTLRLDPKRSPTDNAGFYFKKYKKAKAGKTVITARLQQARGEREQLQSALSRVDHADHVEELDGIRADLVAGGYLPPDPKRDRDRKVAATEPFRTLLFHGWEILVGRSAAGNDYLTTKVARDRDLWLHAEGMPGSHVVIRNPNNNDIPPSVIARAASLAAFHSKGKNSGKVSVAYTPARFVRKPKGAKPGLVMLTERKTIMAVPEEGDEHAARRRR